MRARIILGVVAGLVLGATGSAAADAKRVGVPKFDGPQEAVVRKAVMQVLKRDGYELVGSREIDAASRSSGASLDSNEGFRAVAKELSLAAFVTGEVAKKKAKLTVRNGADGTVAGEGSFAGANPAKVAAEVRDGFGRRLGSAVARGHAPSGAKKPVAAPPPPPEDEPEEEAAPVAASKPAAKDSDAESSPRESTSETASSESGGAAPDVVEKTAPPAVGAPTEDYAPRALDLFVGFRGFNRSLTFKQDLYSELSDYALTLGPALAFDAVIFPAAFATSGILANFGAMANIEQAFGIGASLTTGQTLPTIVHDYSGGLVYRLPFSGGSELSLAAGGGEHAFSLRSGDDVVRSSVTNIPDTIYRYWRVGVGGRLVVTEGFSLNGSVGYRGVINQGGTAKLQIAHDGTPADPTGYFPFLDVKAVDVTAGFGYLVMPSIEIRANFYMRRYAFNMNSSPGQFPDGDFSGMTRVNKVAGGAVDQYTGFTVGVAYVFGGVAPGAQPAVEEEAAPEPKKKKKKAKKADDEDEDGEASGDDSED